MITLDAFQGFALGAWLGALVWVPFGRWSLLLLWRESWRRQYLRQLARQVPYVPAVHAGEYVQPGTRAGWGSLSLEPRQFRVRLPSEQRLKARCCFVV